jgi:hypothetical protein
MSHSYLPERGVWQRSAGIFLVKEKKYIALLSCFSFIVLRYSPDVNIPPAHQPLKGKIL